MFSAQSAPELADSSRVEVFYFKGQLAYIRIQVRSIGMVEYRVGLEEAYYSGKIFKTVHVFGSETGGK